MKKNWKEIVMAKEKAREDAYNDWRDTIKAILSDGVERTIKDEDEEKFNGAIEWIGSGQYVIDRIKFDASHDDFKLRVRMITPDVEKEPMWVFGCCFERAGLDGLLEKIVWD